MRYALALVCACAVLAGTQIAAADQGNSTPTPVVPATQPCTPMKALLSWKRWQEAQPLAGENPCSSPNAKKLMAHFRLYRHYRQITPYRCEPGKEGTFAIPCYIIACESHFDWWARNPSGALWIYQLLGWGAPAPTSFRNRVRNHEIAHSLALSNWACA
jgi:hypothetical protein